MDGIEIKLEVTPIINTEAAYIGVQVQSRSGRKLSHRFDSPLPDRSYFVSVDYKQVIGFAIEDNKVSNVFVSLYHSYTCLFVIISSYLYLFPLSSSSYVLLFSLSLFLSFSLSLFLSFSFSLSLSLSLFNKFNMNNNHLSVNSTCNDHSILNFLLQFTPNQVDYTIDLLDEVVLTEAVIRPIKNQGV